MKRKTLLIGLWSIGLSLLLLGAAIYLDLKGDIPRSMDRNEVEYLKTLDIQPSYGRIWFTSSLSQDPTYYYRLHLSQSDFQNTEIAKLSRVPNEKEHSRGPIWWNPARDAQCFKSASGRHGANYYFYDSRKQLLFARCEM